MSGTSFDRQPNLTGDAVSVRPMTGTDFDALFRIASDKDLWALHPAHDRWQLPVFRKFFDDGLASGGGLVVTDSATGEVVGTSRYDFTYAEPGEVEIGWTFVARDLWGSGTNAALKRLMIEHAFASDLNVMFRVGETNLRSRRAVEKLGARLTDRVQHHAYAGQTATNVVYVLAPGDWIDSG